MVKADDGVIVKVRLSLVVGVAEVIGIHVPKPESVETRIVGDPAVQVVVPVSALTVEGFIASEKVTEIVVPVATLLALFAGLVDATVGAVVSMV